MPKIKKKCPVCNEQIEFIFSDRNFHGELIWSASAYCPSCHFAIELDDRGELHPKLRELELKENGTWGVLIESSDRLPEIGKILRKCLSLSLQEVTQIKKQLPGTIITGTHAECDRVLYHLEKHHN